MTDFTHLETAVLSAICHNDAQDGETLSRLLSAAKVTKRDNTGVGFYTDFEILMDDKPVLKDARFRVASADILDLNEGQMCFWLRLNDDLSGCLEGCLTGTDAELKGRDLTTLRFTKLVPPPQTTV